MGYYFEHIAEEMVHKYDGLGLSTKDILVRVVAELLMKIDTLERLKENKKE